MGSLNCAVPQPPASYPRGCGLWFFSPSPGRTQFIPHIHLPPSYHFRGMSPQHLHCSVAPSHATLPSSFRPHQSPAPLPLDTFTWMHTSANTKDQLLHISKVPAARSMPSQVRTLNNPLAVPPLHPQRLLLVGNLTPYLIRMGRCIMAETTYSNDATPNQLWLPDLPSASFHSQSYFSHDNPASLELHGPHPPSGPPSQHPDPDGINLSASLLFLAVLQVHPPSSFPMGGSITPSFGVISPLTTSDTHNTGGNALMPVNGGSSI